MDVAPQLASSATFCSKTRLPSTLLHARVDPDKLNELDRRILKESFRQARKIQSRLKLDYQVQ